MIGKTVSHYKILEELGRGGMGVVYKAEDTKLKRTVALKFLSVQAVGSQEEKKRFAHEAQAAAALHHPNICTVYEIDEVEGQIFIAMAYLEGESLKDKIEEGPLKLDEVVDIASQVAQGLQEAHDLGIVHRDIKSSNVMATTKGQSVIMDFGLAKKEGRTVVTKEGTTLGTIAYMSPEQTQSMHIDHRTDIWSLGVMIYEMVTGRLPFQGDYDQAVVYSILNEAPEPMTGLRTGVPMELESIVNKCLEKDPSERYQHADELIVDLRRVQKGLKEEIVSPKEVATTKIPGEWFRLFSALFGETFGGQITIKRVVIFAISSWLIINSILFVITSLSVGSLSGFTLKPPKDTMRIGIMDFEARSIGVDRVLLHAVKSELYKFLQGHRELTLIGDYELNQLDTKSLSRKEISRQLDLTFIVTGYLTRADHHYLVDAEVYENEGNRIATHYSQTLPILSLHETSKVIADSVGRKIAVVLGLSPEMPTRRIQVESDSLFGMFSYLGIPRVDSRRERAHREEVTYEDETYRVLVQGRQLLNRQTLEDNLEALTLFEAATLEDTASGDLIAALAEAYYQRGQLQKAGETFIDEAEELLAKAIASDRISADGLAAANYLMSKILLARDDLIQARAFIRAAKKLNRSDPRIQEQFKEITKLYLKNLEVK